MARILLILECNSNTSTRIFMKKIILILLICSATQFTQAQTAKEVLENMLTATDQIKSSAFTLIMNERFGDSYVKSKCDIRLQREPHSIYMKQYYPHDGIELLWVEGKNNGKVLINTNGFPYINISLSPHNSRMRKDSHHSMLTAGFGPPTAILRYSIQKIRSTNPDVNLNDYLELETTTHQGIDCYKLILNQPDFTYENYTLTKDEYLRDIADRNKISEHAIMELNGIRHYSKIKAGTSIRMPNFYAKKTIFYIDKSTMLPIFQQIHDDKGLYEEYEFSNIAINPDFYDKEFTEDCEAYGF